MNVLRAVIVAVATLVLTGCGYELRRQHINDTAQIHLNADPQAKKILSQQLYLMGYRNTDSQDPSALPAINVQNLVIRRYELLGIVTEIRLVLTADVSYQIGTKTYQYTLQATRSYQYNKAAVSALDTEREAIKDWLYQELAYKIGEQYRILLEQDTH